MSYNKTIHIDSVYSIYVKKKKRKQNKTKRREDKNFGCEDGEGTLQKKTK